MATKIKPADPGVWYALAASRILLGFIFLWAFLDKLFGLNFATPAARAWLNGGAPTKGFLMNVEGPFVGFFAPMAGAAWADWLFMLGLAGIGTALLLGICVRLAAVSGSVLLFLMWMASLPLANNPAVDDHLVYITVLMALAFGVSQQKWSLAAWWKTLPVVRRQAWLR